MGTGTVEILRSWQWPEGYSTAGHSITPPWVKLKSLNERAKRDKDFQKQWENLREAIKVKILPDVSIFGLKRMTVGGITPGCFCTGMSRFLSLNDNIECVNPSLSVTGKGEAVPFVTFTVLQEEGSELEATMRKIQRHFPTFRETIPRRERIWGVKRNTTQIKQLFNPNTLHLKKRVKEALLHALATDYSGTDQLNPEYEERDEFDPYLAKAFKAGIVSIAPLVDTTLIRGLNSLIISTSGKPGSREVCERILLEDGLLRSHLLVFERLYSDMMIALLASRRFEDLTILMERSRKLFSKFILGNTLYLKSEYNNSVYDRVLKRKVVFS